MKLKEVRAELERQLLALELEKKKTQDSLLVLEKKFSFSPGTGALSQFRMRELLREIIQQQNTVRLELNRLEKKEKNSVPDPKSVLLIRSLVISLGIIMLVPLFFSIILYEGGEGSFSTSALAPVPALLAEKNSFSASEGPILELRVPVKNEITGDFIFSSELQGLLRTPTGVLIPQKMEKTSQGYAVTLSSTRTFEPGKYSVVLRQGHTLIMEQNFTWGVLALNTNKARYRPGEDAFIGIAVLDDAGNMICNAVVILTITNPDGQREVLSTGNEKIIVSPDCAVRGVTLRPDYYTAYTFSRAGVYAFNLTAFTYQGTRSILETIPVSDQMLFEVYRTAATRIYPPQPYSMNITLHSQEYYQGTITEIVPASFDIQAVNATVTSINEEKEITWNVTVLPHHNYTFSYLFDAPDVSPQFYLLGPLQIGEWKENRSWQIAADIITGVTLDAPTVNQSISVGDTFTMTCTSVCNGIDDPPFALISFENSTSSTCSSPSGISTDSATTGVLSTSSQDAGSSCGVATSATITARNTGTVYISCRAQGTIENVVGGCREVIVSDTTPPNATQLLPAQNSQFNTSTFIEIAVNVTEGTTISIVQANITYPNRSMIPLLLSNATTGTGWPTKFNASFKIPQLAGLYNITFQANDSSNNMNTTERTNFTGFLICGELVGSTFMNQNLSSTTTCFLGNKSNMNLNCAGYEINYSKGGSVGYAFNITAFTNVTIQNCIIKEGNSIMFMNYKHAILMDQAANGTIFNNTINLLGTGSIAVYLRNGANNTNVSLNSIATSGQDSRGLMVEDTHNLSISLNSIKTSGGSAEGIYLSTSRSSIFTSNNITVSQDSVALLLETGILNTIFHNNNFSSRDNITVLDWDNSANSNTLLYSNIHGQINWTKTNLTTNITLVLNQTVYIQNNTVGLMDSPQMLALNETAQIQFLLLGYTSTPQLSKGGSRCDNVPALCNITYDATNRILYANVSGFSNYTTSAGANTLPTPPVTGMPANGSAITNRTPIFDWFNSSDVDGDVISYHIQVDDNARFNNPEINVSSIQDLSSAAPGNTTWYSTIELAVDTRFYWRVRANDSFGYGNWSNGATVDGPGDAQNRSNFTVSSLLSITMFTAGVEFGTVAPGTMTDTSDGVPAPFRSENTGNIDTNVSLNASVIFVTVPINRSAYQFRIRANESNAFSSALSATSWTNMTNSPAAPQVVNLTWRDVRNDFLTDINLSVPNDEPPGFKTSTITFTVTRNE